MNYFYGVADQEVLNSCPEEAVIDYFDSVDIDDVKEYDFPLEIHIFVPMKFTVSAARILEKALEELDENYGNPEAYDYTRATENMEKAAKELVEVIEKEYQPWQCEQTGEKIKYSRDEVLGII